jgi:hypothetical protein
VFPKLVVPLLLCLLDIYLRLETIGQAVVEYTTRY